MIIEALVAPAKLTLSLRVVGIRDDGYHLVDAEMVTLDLADELEVSPPAGAEGQLTIEDRTGGLSVPGGPEDLVTRALHLVGRTADVVVRKAIPAGAGLGGGSADAAAVLRWAGFTDLVALRCRSAWGGGGRGCPESGRWSSPFRFGIKPSRY